jgi:hypothetical protein
MWLMDIYAQYTPMDRMLSHHKTAIIGCFTMTVVNNALISRVAMDQVAMNSHSLTYIVSLSRWYSERHWVHIPAMGSCRDALQARQRDFPHQGPVVALRLLRGALGPFLSRIRPIAQRLAA